MSKSTRIYINYSLDILISINKTAKYNILLSDKLFFIKINHINLFQFETEIQP